MSEDLLDVMPESVRARTKSAIRRMFGCNPRLPWRDVRTIPGAHSACSAALTEWWLAARVSVIVGVINECTDARCRVLAALLCAESVAHLTDNADAAEYRRLVFAWVSGSVRPEALVPVANALSNALSSIDLPMHFANFAIRRTTVDIRVSLGSVGSDVTKSLISAGSAGRYWSADARSAYARSAHARMSRATNGRATLPERLTRAKAQEKLALPLRLLVERPDNIELGTMLLRWPEAVAVARGLFVWKPGAA